MLADDEDRVDPEAYAHLTEEDQVKFLQLDLILSDLHAIWERQEVDLSEREYLLFVNMLRLSFMRGKSAGEKLGWEAGHRQGYSEGVQESEEFYLPRLRHLHGMLQDLGAL